MMMMFDVSNSTIIFSMFMLIPVLRIKQDLYKFVADLFSAFTADQHDDDDVGLPDLPVIKFEDLQARRHRSIDDMCFVCSEEYEGEDVVSQLGRCKHVFHTDCLFKAQRHGFHFLTCPFCRRPFFSSPTPCKHSSSSPYGIDGR